MLLVVSDIASAEQDGELLPRARSQQGAPQERLRIRTALDSWQDRKGQPKTDRRNLTGDDSQATDSTAAIYVETPIGQIMPYFDYEPQRIRERETDCLTICPCPDGIDCRRPGGKKLCRCPEDDAKHPWKQQVYQPRALADYVFTWEPSNVFANPLYFEDTPLERYGHTHHQLIQPFVSAGRFAGQLALLPYQMTIDPVRKRKYTLGHYRPGEWTPRLFYQIPLNTDAALVEAGVLTGLFFAFP